MMWEVWIDGKFSGIVETNFAWASNYWPERAARSGYRVKLKEVS